jgi:sulfite reductase alpha subunit-like flavoprotein
MKLPVSNDDAKLVPVICVGPGTGVAPMRAIIQERIARGESGMQAPTPIAAIRQYLTYV